jgi:hypothetical protein
MMKLAAFWEFDYHSESWNGGAFYHKKQASLFFQGNKPRVQATPLGP